MKIRHESLFGRLQLRSRNIYRLISPRQRAVPNTTAESRYVNFVAVNWIRNHPVRPFEIEARNPGPMLSAVLRAPRRRFKTRGIDRVGVIRIDSNIVNMTVAIKNLPPIASAVFGKINASAV